VPYSELNAFIQKEIEYFRPVIDNRASDVSLENFRKETVSERQMRVSSETYELCGGQVKYGPFKDLRLGRNPWWGQLDLGSQCLGWYEKEILDFFDGLVPLQFDNFIDIGAADGYYAVGILHSKKILSATCFEQSQHGRDVIMENYQQNGSPGKLRIFGTATPEALLNLEGYEFHNALILVDIEGGEFDLFTKSVCNRLKRCTIILEIHHWVDNFFDRYKTFLGLAAEFFRISTIEPIDRPVNLTPEIRHFPDASRLLLASEGRPCQMRFIKLEPF
jgi:hypothetical protein